MSITNVSLQAYSSDKLMNGYERLVWLIEREWRSMVMSSGSWWPGTVMYCEFSMRILETSPFLSEGQGRISSMDDHCSAGIHVTASDIWIRMETASDFRISSGNGEWYSLSRSVKKATTFSPANDGDTTESVQEPPCSMIISRLLPTYSSPFAPIPRFH